ncbi:MAG: FtsW/RodA/SpoVE family cell cycle protein [Phycisphaerales bacterium]|nr:FtsW/RodA/SpoVE family cell cycle protein [Phycisphaerales bacterium]
MSRGGNRVRWVHPGWLIVVAAAVLTLLGYAVIGTTRPSTATRHFVLGGIGVVAAICMLLPPPRRFRQASWLLLGGCILLLLFLLVPGVPDAIVHPRNGARRWINLFATDLQPSELTKIAFVLAMAAHLRFRDHYRRFGGLLLALGLAFPPIVLILIEPDLGTAMLFVPTLLAMLIAAGSRYRDLFLIGLMAIVAAGSMWPLLRPHQKDRIVAMVAQVRGDTRFEQDIGYQGARAMMLVGAGGIDGVGREQAKSLLDANHLPEEHNDMVFAVICLRWGVLGALVVWGLYMLLATGGLLIAIGCRDPFPRLVAVGLTAMLLSQMFINTAMTIGLAPITGLTLPFVSAGGSSLVVAWMMSGILFGIAMRREHPMTREGFAFGGEAP